MGLTIELQDEQGVARQSIIDPQNSLEELLPYFDDATHPMLSSIDLYGDTVFNRLQMLLFLAEWTKLSAKARTPEQRTLVKEIEMLACHCRDEVHLYLKFIGD
jgi:hypothetical protein